MKEKKLESTAFHEAGHAMICIALFHNFEYVTVVPNDNSFGHILRSLNVSINDMSLNEVIEHTMISMAGTLAEEIHGKTSERRRLRGASEDFSNITDFIINFMDQSEADLFVKWIEHRTREILKSRWHDVIKIASELTERKTLMQRDVISLLVPS